MAKLRTNGEETASKNNNDITRKNYTTPEDGSPLGVAVVGLGFCAYQVFGDSLDSIIDEKFVVPIIFCSASIAAGISRLVRNYDRNKTRDTKEE